MEEHTKGDHDYQTTVATVFSLARRAKEIFESSDPEEKRAFLNYLLQNPTVRDKKLEFTMRSPYNVVLELADCPLRGAVVEEVRTVFEKRNDATVYIPSFYLTAEITIS